MLHDDHDEVIIGSHGSPTMTMHMRMMLDQKVTMTLDSQCKEIPQWLTRIDLGGLEVLRVLWDLMDLWDL